MNVQDRQAIDEVFAKLAELERRSGPPEPQAQALVQSRVAEQPSAPYLMAQVIVGQQEGLRQADAYIAELEQRLQALEMRAEERPQGAGGFLSGLFGGGQRGPGAPYDQQPYGQQPYGQAQPQGQRPGGFLSGVAQMAMGVAGGALAADAVRDLFGGGHHEGGRGFFDGDNDLF